jgi:hypothetical protein
MAENGIHAIFRDEAGVEDIFLRRRGPEFRTRVRGVDFKVSSYLDELAPVNPAEAVARGFQLNAVGERLNTFRLTVMFPVRTMHGGAAVEAELVAQVQVEEFDSTGLVFELRLEDASARAGHEWSIEIGLMRLAAELSAGTRLQCCFTCAFSDYDPLASGPLLCFQEVREAYLKVKDKAGMRGVVNRYSEEVHELHWCEEFHQRTPGTGYRG